MEPRAAPSPRLRRAADRLLQTQVRTTALVVATVGFLVAAVLIGLPPQSPLPTGTGTIVVLPELPPEADARSYTVHVAWLVLHMPEPRAELVWDAHWGDDAFAAGTALPMYVAVDDDVAQALIDCAEGRGPGATQADNPPTEIAELPPDQQVLLERLGAEYDLVGSSSRFFRLDDRAGQSYPFSTCGVEAASSITQDDVELHFRAPGITVVTPEQASRPEGAGSEIVRTYVALQSLPGGWETVDTRAYAGTRTDRVHDTYWTGVEAEKAAWAPDSDLGVTSVGPVALDATSLSAARRAERALFWSGLLVGLAGSCLLMLFEALPWRTRDRAVRTPRPAP